MTFVATRAGLARMLRCDEQTFDRVHLYDLDFGVGAHLAGYRLAACRTPPSIG